jgi:hypothetical protein
MDRGSPIMRKRAAHQVWLSERRFVGAPTISELTNAAKPLDRAAKTIFVVGDPVEPHGSNGAQACPLVRATEDARQTRQARPPKLIRGRGNDAVAAYQVPNFPFLKMVDGAPERWTRDRGRHHGPHRCSITLRSRVSMMARAVRCSRDPCQARPTTWVQAL